MMMIKQARPEEEDIPQKWISSSLLSFALLCVYSSAAMQALIAAR
jgi:hypothetical protein